MSSITNEIRPLTEQAIHPTPGAAPAPAEPPDGWRVYFVRARGQSWPAFVNLASGLAFIALDEQGEPVPAYAPLAPLSAWRLPDGEVTARRRGIATDEEPEPLAVPAAVLTWLGHRLWGQR